MEHGDRQSVLFGVSIAALVAAVAAFLLLHNKRPTSDPAQLQLSNAIQAARAEDKNILVLFGASW
jgi:hypothetical protein